MTIIDSANALLKDKEDERPTREEAEKAVKVLIEWAGDDPSREGLIETPKGLLKLLRNILLVTVKVQKIF